MMDSSLRYPTEVSGVSVTVSGLAAPILYVQDQQIDFLVPKDVTGPNTSVCVSRAGMQGCLYAYVGDADGAWSPLVLNEDGTVNSSASPAPGGSVISFFGTGFGVFDPTIEDGMLTTRPLPNSTLSVKAVFGPTSNCRICPPYTPADITYFGTAPGLWNGVAQLNILVPSGSLPGSQVVSAPVLGRVPAYPLRTSVLVYVK